MSQLTKEQRDYFASGAPGYIEKQFPFSLKKLIDTFLEISESTFQYLTELPEEKFNQPPAMSKKKDDETIFELLQRVSLHFLGHTGQIFIIKKELGRGGYFVTGVRRKGREDSRKKWMKWWRDNSKKYDV
jgi:hypothetical protein